MSRQIKACDTAHVLLRGVVHLDVTLLTNLQRKQSTFSNQSAQLVRQHGLLHLNEMLKAFKHGAPARCVMHYQELKGAIYTTKKFSF